MDAEDTVVEEEAPEDEAVEDQGPPQDPENLIPQIQATEEGKKWLKEQAAKAVRLVDADDESRQEWKDRQENQIKLYAGMIGPMGYPAEGMKAPHDPIVGRTLLQMWVRGNEQICPPKGNLIQVQAVGPEDEELAHRREEHLNWQLRHKVLNWVRGHREAYFKFLMSGSVFREHSIDLVTKATRFETLSSDDVIISYTLKDLDPLMRRVPRITRVLRLYKWELEDIRDAGTFANVDKVLESRPPTQDANSQLQDQADEIDGVSRQVTVGASDDPDTVQRRFYRIHQWMTLPGETRMSPVTFTVDKDTKIPVRLTRREDDDPLDRARYDAEKKEYDSVVAGITAQYQQDVLQWQGKQQLGVQAPEPAMPEPPPEPAPVRQVPIHNVIHYRLFPNPHGFYGIGVAYLLENANELVNELEKEYLLAAKFENIQQGFLPKGALGPGRGEIKLQMGTFKELELEAAEMPGVREFKFSGPSEGLRKQIQMTKEDSYSLVSDIDTLTGQAGPTNETKAAAQDRQANATGLLNAVAALYTETMAEEPKMLARDNALFMDEREVYWVTSPDKNDPQAQSRVKKDAFRADYVEEFDFTFTADQRFQTQPQRVQTAMNLITTLMQSYQQLGGAGPSMLYAAYARLFKALDMPDMEKAMGPQPPLPAPDPQPSPMSQVDENAMFMREQDHPVMDDDDDEGHLIDLHDWMESPYYADASPTTKQLAERHDQWHRANLYKKEMKLIEGGAVPPPQPQGDPNATATAEGPPGGMGGGPGYDLGPTSPPGAAGPGIEAPTQ